MTRHRWYDLPFTREESLTADKKFTITCKLTAVVSVQRLMDHISCVFIGSFILGLCHAICPSAEVAVIPERRSSVGVLSKEIRAHNPTRLSMVVSSGENTVSAVCSDVSLPQWHCTTVLH